MQKLLCKLLIIRGGPTIYYLVICLWPQLLCLMYYFLLLALWVAGVIVEFTMHVTLCNIYSIVNSIPNYFTFFDSWCGSLLTSNILMTAATSLNGGEGAVNVSGLEGNPVLYKKLTLPALDPTWYNRTGGKMDYDPLRFNDKGLPIEAGT